MARQRRGCPLRARRSRDHKRATDQHNQIQVEQNSFLDSFRIEEKGSNENNSAPPGPLPTQEQDLHPYRFDPETQLIHIRVKYCLVRIFSLSLSPTPGFVITTIYCILDTVEEDSFCLALSRLAL